MLRAMSPGVYIALGILIGAAIGYATGYGLIGVLAGLVLGGAAYLVGQLAAARRRR